MSDNYWAIHIVSSGGMPITPVSSSSRGVRVRIVPSYVTSTPATIVSSGGMEVYIENIEALSNQHQPITKSTSLLSKYSGLARCKRCGSTDLKIDTIVGKRFSSHEMNDNSTDIAIWSAVLWFGGGALIGWLMYQLFRVNVPQIIQGQDPIKFVFFILIAVWFIISVGVPIRIFGSIIVEENVYECSSCKLTWKSLA